MADRLATRFRKALGVVLLNRGDVARGVGRSYRGLQALERGERRVTESAGLALVAYLRKRAARLEQAADELERTVRGEKKERRR